MEEWKDDHGLGLAKLELLSFAFFSDIFFYLEHILQKRRGLIILDVAHDMVDLDKEI